MAIRTPMEAKGLAAFFLIAACFIAGGDAVGDCAAAFTGGGCKESIDIPCVGKAFPQWITASQQSVEGEFKGTTYKCTDPLASTGCLTIGKGIPPGRVAALPPFPFWGSQSLPIRSCALVGNSPILKKKKAGAEIDTHDVVLRFNNAPTKKYEGSVGRKTTIRWTNQRWSGHREKAGEGVISKFCTPDAQIKADRNCDWGKKQVGYMLNKKVHPMNPAFDSWSEGPFRKKGSTPSSGIKMLMILMHVCQKVDVYGLGGGGDYRVWYWNKYPGFKGKPPANKMKAKLVDKNWNVKKWSFAMPTDLPDPAPGAAAADSKHHLHLAVKRDEVTGEIVKTGAVDHAAKPPAPIQHHSHRDEAGEEAARLHDQHAAEAAVQAEAASAAKRKNDAKLAMMEVNGLRRRRQLLAAAGGRSSSPIRALLLKLGWIRSPAEPFYSFAPLSRRMLKSKGNHSRKMEDGCLKQWASKGFITIK